ncbi:MAG: hypothetical protein ACTSQW_02995, partial [Promethearchaeota archaeon]
LTGIETQPNVSLSYNFEMESSMNYPEDPANFVIDIQNLNTSSSAPGLNITVDLSSYSYTTNNVNYSLILPPYLYPLQNTTYIDGLNTRVNFTIVDRTLYFGEGLVLNGFLNATKGNVIIFYVWNLFVNDELIYESPENLILVFE